MNKITYLIFFCFSISYGFFNYVYDNLLSTYCAGGAKVESRDRLGLTPLMHAATKGRLEAVEFLLKVIILWGQPIKLIQAVSISEFHEY